MNYEEFVTDMKECVFQELHDKGVDTEEEFDEKLHEYLHDIVNDKILLLDLSDIDDIVHDYGISKAISNYIENFGELHQSSDEHWGSNVYTPSLLYHIVFEGILDNVYIDYSALWVEYQLRI